MATTHDDLVCALTRAADTLADLTKGMRILGRPVIAEACNIAEADARQVLRIAGTLGLVTVRQEAAAAVARNHVAYIMDAADADPTCLEVNEGMLADDFDETGEPDDDGIWVRAWVYVSGEEIDEELESKS